MCSLFRYDEQPRGIYIGETAAIIQIELCRNSKIISLNI